MHYINNGNYTFEDIITLIESVSKEDIMRVATKIVPDTEFYLIGEDDE